MIPDFLKKFESDLKKYEREFVRIKAKPRKEKLLEDNLELKDSKFLGNPFFPKDKEYPKDKNGKAMVMVAQLNFEQIPELKSFPKNIKSELSSNNFCHFLTCLFSSLKSS